MHYRTRFWVEMLLGTLTAMLFLVTLVWRDWIEILTGLDPDEGNGTVEIAVVAILLAMSIVAFAAARLEWRRTAGQRGGSQ
jgi:hypothetical protein